MALKTRIKAKPKSAKPAASKGLTIEEAREAYPIGSQELAVVELRELARVADIAREHGNEANRQGTVAKKAFKAFHDKAGMKPDDELRVDGTGYRYDVTYSEKVDSEALFGMVKAGKITEQQFLGVISVLKGPAEHLIGAHVLAELTKPTPGKEFDIRKAPLDKPVEEPTLVRKSSTPSPKTRKRLSGAVEQAPQRVRGKVPVGKRLGRSRRIVTR